LSELIISGLVVAAILGAALIGGYLRSVLPQHHLSDDTKDMVKVGIGFLATLAAMVLGLLVASAKSSYDTKVDEIQQVAAKLILLDRNLREIGAEADPIRARVRKLLVERIMPQWDRGALDLTSPGPIATGPADGDDLIRTLRALAPAGDVERMAHARAIELTQELAQTRSLLVEQTGRSIPMPFLVVLVFWLAAIAASLTLFAPRNGTLVAISVICAFSFASAIFLILEMDQPYTGLIRISDAPLKTAVTYLER
jgi:hypothetical protein